MHLRVHGDGDGIGQSDQSLQAGWESLERKAVVWCLISRSPRADRREGKRWSERVCVCKKERDAKKKRGGGGVELEAATDNAVSPMFPPSKP